MRDTDVSASIAGYYKQILIAIYQLLNCTDSEDFVGIECGADVRVFKSSGERASLEVKFKDSISPYEEDIYKTMYNFYLNSKDDKDLIFTTNVKIELPFSQAEPENDMKEPNVELKRLYILHLLLKYIKNKPSTNEGKQLFSDAKKNIKTKCNNSCMLNKKYDKANEKKLCKTCLEQLAKYYLKNPKQILKILNLFKSQEDFYTFVSKIEFQFEELDKWNSKIDIKRKSIELLKENFNNYMQISKEEDYEAIFNKISMEFFDYTVVNSMLKGKDYKSHKKISKSQVIEMIQQHHHYIEEYKNDKLLEYIHLYESIPSARLDGLCIIEQYKKERAIYEDYFNAKHRPINLYIIKKVFEEKNHKFFTLQERDALAERFMTYAQGLDLIGFIITLDILDLTIFKEKVIIRSRSSSLCIKNEQYYQLENIKNYISERANQTSSFYDVYHHPKFVANYAKSDIDGDITIFKTGQEFSLAEYEVLNELDLKIFIQLKQLIHDKKNILILKGRPKLEGLFYRALVESIPDKYTTSILTDNPVSIPDTFVGNRVIIRNVDDLDGNYVKDLEKYKAVLTTDICILEPFTFFNNVYESRRSLKKFFNEQKGIIAFLNDSVSTLNNKSFNDLQTRLSYQIEETGIDAFIILDERVLDGEKRDTIKIITPEEQ
ncbi:hypothetical protein ACQKNC_21880 [Lysinibacillus sp. NPDC094177]|uniref:hypothetical protein n=1 Tax=Lysinibacillus sp. NPDC094177 TaxID=3390580 RepID=UPI003CFC00F8